MGVDTKVLLTNPPSILDLLAYAEETYSRAKLRFCKIGDGGFYRLEFRDGKDQRTLSVFPPDECASDYADAHTGPAIYISMGCWGNSEAIARRLAIKYGGMVMPNDCTDDWQNVHRPPDTAA